LVVNSSSWFKVSGPFLPAWPFSRAALPGSWGSFSEDGAVEHRCWLLRLLARAFARGRFLARLHVRHTYLLLWFPLAAARRLT
jgi:hypothetical protein